jgi:hypothetical protein
MKLVLRLILILGVFSLGACKTTSTNTAEEEILEDEDNDFPEVEDEGDSGDEASEYEDSEAEENEDESEYEDESEDDDLEDEVDQNDFVDLESEGGLDSEGDDHLAMESALDQSFSNDSQQQVVPVYDNSAPSSPPITQADIRLVCRRINGTTYGEVRFGCHSKLKADDVYYGLVRGWWRAVRNDGRIVNFKNMQFRREGFDVVFDVQEIDSNIGFQMRPSRPPRSSVGF